MRCKQLVMKYTVCTQMWIPKEELSLDKIKQAKVRCWSYPDKITVVSDYILPTCCEKMGKTIIFVRFRESAAELHHTLRGKHTSRRTKLR